MLIVTCVCQRPCFVAVAMELTRVASHCKQWYVFLETIMDEPGFVSNKENSVDNMGQDFDKKVMDPIDARVGESVDSKEKWEDIAISQSSKLEKESSETYEHEISLRRSPEDPCLPKKITSDVQNVSTPVPSVQQPQLHTTEGLPPLKIPGGHVVESETDKPVGQPTSFRERFKHASRQIKQGRLKKPGQSEERPMTYLQVPPMPANFLKRSSLSGLTKREHRENDIGLSDEDIPVFGRRVELPQNGNVGWVRRALRAVVGAARCLVVCTADCVWRCFGGDPGADETVSFKNNSEPKLEFSGLLEEEEKQASRPTEISADKGIRNVRKTTV